MPYFNPNNQYRDFNPNNLPSRLEPTPNNPFPQVQIYETPNTSNPPPGVMQGARGGGIYPPNINPSPYNPNFPPEQSYPYIIGQEPYTQPFPNRPSNQPFNPRDPYGMYPPNQPFTPRPTYFPPAQIPGIPPSNSQPFFNNNPSYPPQYSYPYPPDCNDNSQQYHPYNREPFNHNSRGQGPSI